MTKKKDVLIDKGTEDRTAVTFTMTPSPLPEWEDRTSYSRDEPHPRRQRIWSLKLARGLSLSLVRGHLYYPNQWVMHLTPITNSPVELPRDIDLEDVETAKYHALKAARHLLNPFVHTVLILESMIQKK